MSATSQVSEKIHAIIPHWWGGKDLIHIESEKSEEMYQIHVQVFNQSPLAKLGANFFKSNSQPAHSQDDGTLVYKNTVKKVSSNILEDTKKEIINRLKKLLSQRQALESQQKSIEKEIVSIQETIDHEPAIIAGIPSPTNEKKLSITPKQNDPSSVLPLAEPVASPPSHPIPIAIPISLPVPQKAIESIPGITANPSPIIVEAPPQPIFESIKSPATLIDEPSNSAVIAEPMPSIASEPGLYSLEDSENSDIPVNYPPETFEPSSESLEVRERLDEIEALKKETEDLLQKIEEEKTHLEEDLRFNETIQKTKTAALEILQNASSSSDEDLLQQLENRANALRQQNSLLAKQIEEIRNFRSEKTTTLNPKADDNVNRFLEKLKEAGFSKEIQDQFDQWHDEALSKDQSFDAIVKKICSMCKQDIHESIQKATSILDKKLPPLFASNKRPEHEWQTTHAKISKSAYKERSKTWKELEKSSSALADNLDAVIALKNAVTQATLTDEALIDLLSQKQESSILDYVRKPQNYSYTTSIHYTIKTITINARTLLKNIQLDNQNYFESTLAELTDSFESTLSNLKQKKIPFLKKNSNLTFEQFHTLTTELLQAARLDIQKLSEENKRDLYDLCDKIQGLDNCLDVLATCHNNSREDFLRNAGGGLLTLQDISKHSSIELIFGTLIKSASWGPQTKLPDIKSDEKNWQAIVERSKKVRSCLRTLAATHAIYQKNLEAAREYIKKTDDGDIDLNKNVISTLQRRKAVNKHLSLESSADPKVISKYEAIVKAANADLEKLIKSAKSRETSCTAIILQITQFLGEIETYRTKLKSIEKTYNIHLKDAHDLLDQQKQKIDALKESALLPTWTILSYLPSMRKDSQLKALDTEKLKQYQQVVKVTINDARMSLNLITQANEQFAAFENQCKLIETRIAEIKIQGIPGQTDKLEHAYLEIKEKQKPTIGDEDEPKNSTLSSATQQVKNDTAKLKSILNEFNESLKKTDRIRKKIIAEIDAFVKETETNRKNLSTIEAHYRIDLKPVHDLLDKEQENIAALKESITFRNWYFQKTKQPLVETEPADLRNYQQYIHEAIVASRDSLINTANIPKAFAKHQEFLKQCTEADLRIRALKNSKPKQLLHALNLEQKLNGLKNIRDMSWRTPIKWRTFLNGLPMAAFSYFDGMTFTGPLSNISIGLRKLSRPLESVIWGVLLEGAHTNFLKKAIAESKREKPMSIPAQLTACKLPLKPWVTLKGWAPIVTQVYDYFPKINRELAQELREEFLVDINKKIEVCEKQLLLHADMLNNQISHYVAPNSEWFETMETNINDKIGMLVAFKDKLLIKRGFSIPYPDFKLPKFWKPRLNVDWWTYYSEYNVSDLSPSRLEDYDNKVNQLVKNLVKELNNETNIFNVGQQHKELIAAIETANELAKTLVKNNHFNSAKELKKLTQDIKQDIENEKNSINSVAQMRALVIRLQGRITKLSTAIRKNQLLANKASSAIEQLAALTPANLDSPEAKALHELALKDIRANIENFMKKIDERENLIHKLEQENVFNLRWRDKLLNLLDSYKTEIAPFTSGLTIRVPKPPSFIGRVLLGRNSTLVEEAINLEDLTIPHLITLYRTVATICAEKIEGASNRSYRLQLFDDLSNIVTFDTALTSYRNQAAIAEEFLKEGFSKITPETKQRKQGTEESRGGWVSKKVPETKQRKQGMENLRLILSHINNISNTLTQKLYGGYEAKECIKFLNKAKDLLSSAIEEIKKDKSVILPDWVSMVSIEASNPQLANQVDYLRLATEPTVAHRNLRNKFLLGSHQISEKRNKAALKAALEAAESCDLYPQLIQNQPAINAGRNERGTALAAGKSFAEVAAAGSEATAQYAKLHDLPEGVMIASVAVSAAIGARDSLAAAPIANINVDQIKIEQAGIAVGKAAQANEEDPAEVARMAAVGAGWYVSLIAPVGVAPANTGRDAGRAAAKAALTFGASPKQFRKAAGAAAGRAAVVQRLKNVPLPVAPILAPPHGLVAPPLSYIPEIINIAADAAAAAVQDAGGNEEAQRIAAAEAAGEAAALQERLIPVPPRTQATLVACAATAAAIRAATDINNPPPLVPFLAPNLILIYNAAHAAAEKERAAGADFDKIGKAAAEAAAKAAAPILRNTQANPGSIHGNLIATRDWATQYIPLLDRRLVDALNPPPPLSQEKRNQIIALRNFVRDNQLLITNLSQGLPENGVITPYDQLRSSEQLLKYAETSMRACNKLRSGIEEKIEEINKERPAQPILTPLVFPTAITWDFIGS